MSPSVGARIWIPCEVRPGPFPDERMAKVGQWTGFVPVTCLEAPVESGSTRLLATILEVGTDTYTVALPGDALTGRTAQGSLGELTSCGSL